MVLLLIAALAVTGGLLAWPERGWLAGVPLVRRVVYGAAAGAILGLLLIPLLGLVAALALFLAMLAVLAALVLMGHMLLRYLARRWP